MNMMIKLDYIALYVRDLNAAKEFFIEFLDALPSELYHNQKTGFKSYFLRFDNDTRREIMSRPGLDHSDNSLIRTGYVHIAFRVGSRDKVDRLTARLKDAGYKIISGPRLTGDGY